MIKRRRRFKQTDILEVRLGKHAIKLRDEAKHLPASAQRDDLLRRARQAEEAARMCEWLRGPHLVAAK